MWTEIAVMKTESCFEWLKSFSHKCIPQHTSLIYSPPNASLSITTSCLERKQGIMCQCLSDTVTYTVSELLLASVTYCPLLEGGSWEVKNWKSVVLHQRGNTCNPRWRSQKVTCLNQLEQLNNLIFLQWHLAAMLQPINEIQCARKGTGMYNSDFL